MLELNEIKVLIFNGQWKDAANKFKRLNCTATEFQNYMYDEAEHVARDFALLGFYAKEFIPKEK